MLTAAIDRFPDFQPWIGGAYRTRQFRLAAGDLFNHSEDFLHVMGESHYSEDYEWSADTTTRVICDWAFSRTAGGAFFTKILQAVQASAANDVDRVGGWSNIAFSNYVQDLLPGSRLAPTGEQWARGARCFVGQLAITRPRVLLVLGQRLWEQLPSFGEQVARCVAPNGVDLEGAWLYPFWIGDRLHITLAIHSFHPSSSRFNWRNIADRLTAANMLYDNLAAWTYEQLRYVAPVRREPDDPIRSAIR